MAKVFVIKKNFEEGIKKAYNLLSNKLSDKPIAIKLHFGERGNTTYIQPELVKALVNEIKQEKILTDANVLYRGSRTDTSSHKQIALEHGFDFAPVKIADEKGEISIEINKKHFKTIKVGSLLQEYENIIVFSHFKGHSTAGFGGALKNLGMGFGSRSGKLAMHANISPFIDTNICILCNNCKENCPANAIQTINNKNIINKNKCIGCAKCIAVCPKKAVKIPWGSATEKQLQERIVEYCYGILKDRNLIYFNVLLNITKRCDCVGSSMKQIIDDIGILASGDIVAIDQASLDLVNKQTGKQTFQDIHGVSGIDQLIYAEKLGLGTRKYELIKI